MSLTLVSTHIPYKQDEFHGVGTSLFTAINIILTLALVRHLSFHFNLPLTRFISESSRRDELESLQVAYMLIYFIHGTLPWRKIRATPDPRAISNSTPQEERLRQYYNLVSATWDLIRDAKIANEELLTLGLPQEFDVLYRYARLLEFNNLPDYEGLRNLFRGLAECVGIEYEGVYDWSALPTAASSIGGPGQQSISKGSGSGGRRYCEPCNARRR
jgi:casein kinase I family protein HRR25